ncbi:hypothetical protein [Candidatus Aalborgicola defluviihabitans]|uniref:hypothetical protein n=1 Tax=Candidatus Aalborgicola defluviihabitans TaxID=3386187 RepID=UPI001D6E83C9|nr:hypothetical protein [Burkholderiales bacterium]
MRLFPSGLAHCMFAPMARFWPVGSRPTLAGGWRVVGALALGVLTEVLQVLVAIRT